MHASAFLICEEYYNFFFSCSCARRDLTIKSGKGHHRHPQAAISLG